MAEKNFSVEEKFLASCCNAVFVTKNKDLSHLQS